ncbi:S-layer homology domain-containing protein [Paenibacillus sp. GD4]|uniref:S-layer homology domain-containing protein n=1 Tax=Paenibacillus sp. GD4 TaxID=3068890 RepID=UPI00279690BD|nr:S-layer homology domain-containing protein [Paenibacillus sp. GD4]MDQ1913777.1 S-layer homology domain-containing protein [Paenibacillus sp. GD4]
MKRLYALCISLLLICPVFPVSALAAQVSVQASAAAGSGQVTISGTIASGAGKQVTVMVTSPAGTIDYLDQTASGENGTYTFTYRPHPSVQGTYRVTVGGSGVTEVQTTTFVIPPTEGSDPGNGGGDPGNGGGDPGNGGGDPGNGGGDPGNGGGDPGNGGGDPGNGGGGSGNGGGGSGIGGAGPQEPIVRPNEAAVQQAKRADGQSVAVIVLTGEAFGPAINWISSGNHVLTIDVSAYESVDVQLPLSVLESLAQKHATASLAVATGSGTYELPLSALAGRMDPQGRLSIAVGRAPAPVEKDINAVFGPTLASAAIEYKVTMTSGGQTVEWNDFGSQYVNRSVPLLREVNPAAATGLRYDPATKEFAFVPTVFVKTNGQWNAVLKRNGNSIYAVIEMPKSFADLNGSWAQGDVEMLASKRIVNGVSANEFAPHGQVTRAEFAALLVRALGLTTASVAAPYSDVQSGDWFAPSVATAAKYKLISGYEDGSFGPQRPVTREEAAVMIVRAISVVGKAGSAKGTDNEFTDAASISEWARLAVSTAVQDGIVSGRPDGSFAPQLHAIRAEAAVMVKRMLVQLQFINR